MMDRAEVVIIGAGIAGISAAYQLAKRGVTDVVIVDPLPPLSLTSDKSTECYRNFWPGPDGTMTEFMNRSIDLLDEFAAETNNAIGMNRRGYLYATNREEHFRQWKNIAVECAGYGAGSVSIPKPDGSTLVMGYPIPGWEKRIGDGVTLLEDAHAVYPYLRPGAFAMHVRRAGWLKSDLLGRLWLDSARDAGVRLVRGEIVAVETMGGKVSGVQVRKEGTEDGAPATEFRIACSTVVNAAGPLCHKAGRLAGIELPVFSELHLKLNFRDTQGGMPRDAPLIINDDRIDLPWSTEEREALAADPSTRFLTQTFPAGVHGRPEGHDSALLLWTYHLDPVEPEWPIKEPPYLAEAVVRGMSTLLPAFETYLDHFDRPILDGGYYTKTRENRPLIGATQLPGFFLTCAYSGYGIMAAAAGGELLALSVLGGELPGYAKALSLARYDDPDYLAMLESWQDTSQL